jgi:SAM-dependent methyltransferase
MDPLAGTPWSARSTVEGFSRGEPNAVLVNYARQCLDDRGGHGRAIDIGCGAGRNTLPLAHLGWQVLGLDLSRPMLDAARDRARDLSARGTIALAMAPMDALPARDRTFDLIVAHGIWNLARSSAEFRTAVREAARVAADDAALFVFTFSRHTLPPDARPVAGEDFVFTQFSGQPQCFLTDRELLSELARVGFMADPAVPLREHNRPVSGQLATIAGPVIYETAFRFRRVPL